MSKNDVATCDEARLLLEEQRHISPTYRARLARFIDQAEALRQEHTALLTWHKGTITERDSLRTGNAKLRAACEAALAWFDGAWLTELVPPVDDLREALGDKP